MNNDTEQQLKPCPFCGAPAQRGFNEYLGHYVYCPTISCFQIKTTAEKWNSRTPDPFKAQLLEWLEKKSREAYDKYKNKGLGGYYEGQSDAYDAVIQNLTKPIEQENNEVSHE